MSELNGQVLGLLLVVAVFAAMVPTLISLFNRMVDNVDAQVSSVISDYNLGDMSDPDSSPDGMAYITSDLLSF